MTQAKPQFVPRRASTIAMWLFLAALAMLFIASLVGYVLVRMLNPQFGWGTVHLPKALFVSTLMMLAASYTMHRALGAIRREKQSLFRTYLSMTLVLASVFVVIQTPAMVELLRSHKGAVVARDEARRNTPAVELRPDSSNNADEVTQGNNAVPPFGLVAVLILVHALHVIGGMGSLGVVSYNAYHHRYDHEHYVGVGNCVLYWHFLDVVWVLMFTVLLAFG